MLDARRPVLIKLRDAPGADTVLNASGRHVARVEAPMSPFRGYPCSDAGSLVVPANHVAPDDSSWEQWLDERGRVIRRPFIDCGEAMRLYPAPVPPFRGAPPAHRILGGVGLRGLEKRYARMVFELIRGLCERCGCCETRQHGLAARLFTEGVEMHYVRWFDAELLVSEPRLSHGDLSVAAAEALGGGLDGVLLRYESCTRPLRVSVGGHVVEFTTRCPGFTRWAPLRWPPRYDRLGVSCLGGDAGALVWLPNKTVVTAVHPRLGVAFPEVVGPGLYVVLHRDECLGGTD